MIFSYKMAEIFDDRKELEELVFEVPRPVSSPQPSFIEDLKKIDPSKRLISLKNIGVFFAVPTEETEDSSVLHYGPFKTKFVFGVTIRANKELLFSDYVLNIATLINGKILIPFIQELAELENLSEMDLESAFQLVDLTQTLGVQEYIDILQSMVRTKVISFWKTINEKYVPYLIARFNNSKVFGDINVKNEFLLEKIQRMEYMDPRKKQNKINIEHYLLKTYNQNSDTNKELGLPEEIKRISDLRNYHKKLCDAHTKYSSILFDDFEENEEIEGLYSGILMILENDYAGKGIDFSKVGGGPGYRYVPVDPDNVATLRILVENMLRYSTQFSEKYRELNTLWLMLPETYDLVLKSNADFDIDCIKYGLFLAYLDEFYLRSRSNEQSRYILSLTQLHSLIQRFNVPFPKRKKMMQAFMPLPFIPGRKNRLNATFNSELIGDFLTPLDQRLQNLPTLEDFEGIRYHVNGSSLTLCFDRDGEDTVNIPDVDVRLDSVSKDGGYLSDEAFDAGVEHYVQHYKLENLTKVTLSNPEKYKYSAVALTRGNQVKKKYEFFRGSFGAVANYHVPCVRMDLSKNNDLLIYPSCVVALITGYNIDLRYFTTENSNPMKVVEKYNLRGYSFFLNSMEMALYIEYVTRNSKLIVNQNQKGIFYPYRCLPKKLRSEAKAFRTLSTSEDIMDALDNIDEAKSIVSGEDYLNFVSKICEEPVTNHDIVAKLPRRCHSLFWKHAEIVTHNKIMGKAKGKLWLQSTVSNLPVVTF